MSKSISLKRRFLTLLGLGVAFNPLTSIAQTVDTSNTTPTDVLPMTQTTTPQAITVNPTTDGYKLTLTTTQNSEYSSYIEVKATLFDNTGNPVPFEGDLLFYNIKNGQRIQMQATSLGDSGDYMIDYSQPEDNDALIIAEYYIDDELVTKSNTIDVTNLGLVTISVEFAGIRDLENHEYDYTIYIVNFSGEEMSYLDIGGDIINITDDIMDITVKSDKNETIDCKAYGKDGNYTSFYIVHRPEDINAPYIPYVDIPPQHYIIDKETKTIVYSKEGEFFYDGRRVIDKYGRIDRDACRQDEEGNVIYRLTGDLVLDKQGNFYTTPVALTDNPMLPRVSCVIITHEGDMTNLGILVRDAFDLLPSYMLPKLTYPEFDHETEYIITESGYKILDGTLNLVNKYKETVIHSNGTKGDNTQLKEDGLYDTNGGIYIDTKGNVYDENGNIVFDQYGQLVTGKIARDWLGLEPSFKPDIPLTPLEPSTPVEPDIPLTPIEPSIPIEPDIPLTPLEPSTPTQPDIPLTPLEPSTPVEPELPDVPLTPLEPSIPVEPDIPLTPLEPSIPVQPDIPLTPIEPSTPVEPDVPLTPLEPSTPIEPELPDIPLTPIEPSTPVQPQDQPEDTNNQDHNQPTETTTRRHSTSKADDQLQKLSDRIPYTIPINTRIDWASLLNVHPKNLKTSCNYFTQSGYTEITFNYKGAERQYGFYVVELNGETNAYDDIKSTHWAKQSIYTVSNEGIMKGEGNTYSPNTPLTFAEICKAIDNTLLCSSNYTNINGRTVIDDCINENYIQDDYTLYTVKSVASKLSEETLDILFEDKTINPTAPITRDNYALIIADLVNTQLNYNVKYTDYDLIVNKEAVSKLYTLGIMKGYAGKFNPDQLLTKAELATTLDRLLIHLN